MPPLLGSSRGSEWALVLLSEALAVDRCAIFVDAGYVFAEGGKLCGGSAKR